MHTHVERRTISRPTTPSKEHREVVHDDDTVSLREVGDVRHTVDLSEMIDQIGFGLFQLRVTFVVGLIFAAEAIEVFLLTFIRPLLLRDLAGASESTMNVATSVVFLGMLIGSIIFGTAADKLGRRKVLLVIILVPTLGGALSCIATDAWSFIAARAFVGIGVGGGHVAPSLLMELLPTKKREKYVIISYAWWTIGVLYICGCAWGLREQSWRLLGVAALLPYLLCLACLGFVPESPRYHCVHGYPDRALATLQRIAVVNGRVVPHHPPKAHDNPEHTALDALKLLFCPSIRRTTLLLILIWCAANASYYGIIMLSTQQILGGGGDESFGAAAIESAGELPTYFILYYFAHRSGRRTPLVFAPLVGVAAFMVMRASRTTDKSVTNLFFIIEVVAAFVCRCAVLFLFDLVYLYTPEVYPTSVRGTGSGLCSAAARLTGMTTPFVAYTIYRVNSEIAYAFFAVLLVASSVAAKLLPLDTGGQPLVDELPEEIECSSHISTPKVTTSMTATPQGGTSSSQHS